MARSTSPFSRRSSGGGNRPTSYAVPLTILSIVDDAASGDMPKDVRYSENAADIRQKYNHVVCALESDVHKDDGSILHPKGTEVTLVVFASGENARDIQSLRNPSGSAPYLDNGDILIANGTFNFKSDEGVVFQARRINAGLTLDQTLQPVDMEEWLKLSPEDRQNAPFYSRGGVYSGDIVVTNVGHAKDDPSREFQSALVIESQNAVNVEGINGIKGYMEELRQNDDYQIGKTGVNVILYKKDGDPTDLDNRVAQPILVSDKKQEDGSYVTPTVDEVMADFQEHNPGVAADIESGEWTVAVMPIRSFQISASMLPGNRKNIRGDIAVAFENVDTDTGAFMPGTIGAQRGFICATQPTYLVNQEGQYYEGDTTRYGEAMKREKGMPVPIPSGALPEGYSPVLASQTYAQVIGFETPDFGNHVAVKYLVDKYNERNPGDSIAAQKAAFKEVNGEAMKRFGSYPATPGMFLPDCITPVTPPEYVKAIQETVAQEKNLAKNIVAEMKKAIPDHLFERENNRSAPSNSPSP